MSDLKGQGGELRCTVTVTRKATGKVETYDVVSTITEEQAQELGLVETKEKDNGRNS